MKPMPVTDLTQRQNELARRIEHDWHINYSLRIVMEAERHAMPVSVALAVIDQETHFKNVYGHDGVRNPIKSPVGGLREVTHKNYILYKKFRQIGLGSQGVGPMQLTWKGYQDEADHDGGCWVPSVNIATGLAILDGLGHSGSSWHDRYQIWNAGKVGTRDGIRYADSVAALQTTWHRRLT